MLIYGGGVGLDRVYLILSETRKPTRKKKQKNVIRLPPNELVIICSCVYIYRYNILYDSLLAVGFLRETSDAGRQPTNRDLYTYVYAVIHMEIYYMYLHFTGIPAIRTSRINYVLSYSNNVFNSTSVNYYLASSPLTNSILKIDADVIRCNCII